METKEMKPTSFRISDEIKERFKEISKSEGWNQDEALGKLIAIYELEQAKVIISSRKTEIETFESHLQALSEVYRMSLQLNQDAEERIKAAYINTLQSNQKTIQGLQSENEELKSRAEDMQASASVFHEKSILLEKEVQRFQSEIEKTDKLCVEYKEKNDTLNGLLVEYKADREENKTLRLKNEEHEQDLKKTKSEHETIVFAKDKEIENAKSDMKTKILELKEKHSSQVEELNNKYNQEIEKSNLDYRGLLQELEQLRKENYELKGQLHPKPAQKKKTTTKKDDEN